MRRTLLLLVTLALTLGAACGGEPTSDTLPPATVSSTTVTTVATTATSEPTATTPPTTTTSTTLVIDVEPPVLSVTAPEEDANLTTRAVRFEGITEPGATVEVWDRWVAEVAEDGSWSIVLMLNPGTNIAQFTATDPAGNTTLVESVVRYTPPTTTTQPGTVAKTEVITYMPTVIPDEHREGWCVGPSARTPRGYWCSTEEDVILDPCFDTGEVIVCGADPITGDLGFVLDLIEPLPNPPGDPHPWILELYDGVVCYYKRGTHLGYAYWCSDSFVDELRPGEVWTCHRVTLSPEVPFEVLEDFGWVPIRTIWW